MKQQFNSTAYTRLVDAYYDNIADQIQSNPYISLYFVTTAFADLNCTGNNQFHRKVEYAFTHYHRFYCHLSSMLMNNFSRKRSLQPRTVDFADLPNSKYSRSLNFYEPTTPHIHSIYFIHPSTFDVFEDLRHRSFGPIVYHHAMSQLVSVYAKPIVLSELKRVLSYSAKLLNNDYVWTLSSEVELFKQYPMP